MTNQSTKDGMDTDKERLSERIKRIKRDIEMIALSADLESEKAYIKGLQSVDNLSIAGFRNETLTGRSALYVDCVGRMKAIAEEMRQLKDDI